MIDPLEPCADRRGFLRCALSACALTCLGLPGTRLEGAGQQAAQAGEAQRGAQSPPHKFDEEYPARLTYRQIYRLRYGSAFIPLVQVLKTGLGQEKTIALLKEFSSEDGKRQAQSVVQRYGGRDLATIKKFYGSPELRCMWSPEIVLNTDSTYELRVTECLWATTFRQANLGDEGYAAVCLADVALVEALNPKISLVRDKTLMRGHDYCNHRYVVKE